MTTASDLARLGWPTHNDTLVRWAVAGFQRGWNLGPALVEDGVPGPVTRAAIAASIARLNMGAPTASQHFSFTEFACECDRENPNCHTIWQTRRSIQMCENYRRALAGPLYIVRGCRCKLQNDRVGGAPKSQHLDGNAVDLPVFLITLAQVIAKRVGATGVGTYDWQGKRLVRHLDTRSGPSIEDPADWDYGDQRSLPLTPRPDLASDPLVPKEDSVSTPAEQEAFAQRVADKILWAPTFPGQDGLGGSSIRNNIGMTAAWTQASLELLRQVAAKQGVDVDEEALAKALLTSLAPQLAEVVTNAAKQQGVADPAALAKAVVSEMGAALSPKETA